MKFRPLSAILGINPENRCFETDTVVDVNREKTMSNKTMLATLALGAAVAFAAPPSPTR